MPPKATAGIAIVALNLCILYLASLTYVLAVTKGLMNVPTLGFPIILGFTISIISTITGTIKALLALKPAQTGHDVILATANSIILGGITTLVYLICVIITGSTLG